MGVQMYLGSTPMAGSMLHVNLELKGGNESVTPLGAASPVALAL